ncbi:MAG: hypothetical protein KatS3mg036_0119 [Ignavibacterium sp.]|nr:MAG: hypothetical protein KatS3mg036_0119 [Ignavibacterium sp.]
MNIIDFTGKNHPRMADLYPGIVDILEELKKEKF